MSETDGAARRTLNVLIVEDSPDDAALVLRALRREGFDPRATIVETTDDLHRALDERPWDVIVSDYNLPGFDGFEALRIVRGRDQDTPFILVSGTVGEETAVLAMKAGANDYVMKENLSRLGPAVDREIRELEERRRAMRERHALQSQLYQSQKLEALGTLAGGVAHDFNNLLVVIRGNAELSLAMLEPGLEVREQVEQICEAANRAERLVQQLLLFSRRKEMRKQALNLRNVIDQVSALLDRALGEQVRLVISHEASELTVEADAGLLEQLLMNLATNARDAMDGGGTIRIETALVHLDAETARGIAGARPGTFVRVSVIDSGHGIDPDLLERIFEPFFTTKEAGKGTGLGLATAYGVVREHGGWISVDSEIGAGTTFHVYLPAAADRAAEPARDDSPEETTGSRRCRILVLEDDASVRGLTTTVLSRHGHEVVASGSCSEATRAFEHAPEPFDVMISDVVLPDGSGVDTAARLLSRAPNLRVVLTSGYDIDAPTLPGARVRYLYKPFGPSQLLEQVDAALRDEVPETARG